MSFGISAFMVAKDMAGEASQVGGG